MCLIYLKKILCQKIADFIAKLRGLLRFHFEMNTVQKKSRNLTLQVGISCSCSIIVIDIEHWTKKEVLH